MFAITFWLKDRGRPGVVLMPEVAAKKVNRSKGGEGWPPVGGQEKMIEMRVVIRIFVV